jgi:RNA ligase (TIGR02306 family)
MNYRKLASIQRIAEIKPIEGADFICAYRINGWFVIDKINKYNVNDLVVYLEIDSWSPYSLTPFLTKEGKEPRMYNGIQGERLRSKKMKGIVSQGLILPIPDDTIKGAGVLIAEGLDLTDHLGIAKYEPPAEFMAANAKGLFPSFIPKTNQERVQNLTKELEGWTTDGSLWEKTEKLHGTSFTAYISGCYSGVCSRNLELKIDDENTYNAIEKKYRVLELIKSTGLNLAIQGEIIGSNICGNMYNLSEHRLYVFDVFDIDKQEYYLPEARWKLCSDLGLPHVPLLGFGSLVGDSKYLLEDADGMSSINSKSIREGFVLKHMSDPMVSFKVVSNSFLLKHEG